MSPACAKLETWLRVAKVPYVVGAWPTTVAPPKGKWPYVEDDGAIVGDSTLIIDRLKRTRGVDPDARLSASERAIGVAFRRMIKENLNWALAQIRYLEPAGWTGFRAALAPIASTMFAGDAGKIAEFQDGLKQTVVGQMYGHGIGRHSNEELYQIYDTDLGAIADYLGDKPYFFGSEPTGTDATVFGYLTNIIDVPLDTPITRFARKRENLVAHCRRVRARYFPELTA